MSHKKQAEAAVNTVQEDERSFPLKVVHLAKGNKRTDVNIFEQFSLTNSNSANLQRFLFLQMERTGQFVHKTFMLSLEKLEQLALPGSRLWVQLQKKKKQHLRNAFDRMFFKLWAELYKTQHILYKRAAHVENVIDEILENVDSETLQEIKKDVVAVKAQVAENIKAMDEEQKPPVQPTRETYRRINEETHVQESLLARLYARLRAQPEVVNKEEQPKVEQRVEDTPQPEFDPDLYREHFERTQRPLKKTKKKSKALSTNDFSRAGGQNSPTNGVSNIFLGETVSGDYDEESEGKSEDKPGLRAA